MSLEFITASLGELTGDAMCICRDPGPGIPMELVWANADLQRLTGYSFEELQREPLTRLHAGVISPETNTEIHNTIIHGGQWRGELLCIRSDGSQVWADVSIRADLGSADDEKYVLHVYRDIDSIRKREIALSERQIALEAAQFMEERLRAAVEAFQGSFALFDADLKLVLCNERYKHELTDNPSHIRPGMTMREATVVGVRSGKMPLLPGLDEEGMVRYIEDAYNTPGVPVETKFADGRVSLSVRTRSKNGDYIVSRTDITEITEQRGRLTETNAALSETLEQKEVLLNEVKQARTRLSAGMEAIPDAFAIYDKDYKLVICNSIYAAEWSDNPADVMPGIAFRDLMMMGIQNGKLDPGDQEPELFLDEFIPSVWLVEDEPIISEFRPGHFVRSLRQRASNGDLVVLRTDISEIVHQRRVVEDLNTKLHAALNQREELYGRMEQLQDRLINAFEALPDAIAVFDSDDRLVHFNRAYVLDWTDETADVKPGMSASDLLRLGLQNRKYQTGELDENAFVEQFLRENHVARDKPVVQELRTGYFTRTIRRASDRGDLIVLRSDVSSEVQQKQHLEAMNRQLEDTRRDVQYQAAHDALTGVRNRRGLSEALETLLDKSAATGPHADVCVLHVDLDKFKGVNDTLGHAAGDFVLCQVVNMLRQVASEVASDDAIIARVGGDEFVVAMASFTPEECGMKLATRIVDKAAEPFFYEGKECLIGASVGVAASPVAGSTQSELLINSDTALYYAKNAGRNRAHLFDSALRAEVGEQKKLADAMIAGLPRGEFVPAYQLQFDAATLDVIGLEALARWKHPEKGLLSPDRFLGIAEGLGAVARIDERIFETAISQTRSLLDQGLNINSLSLNVSGDRLRHPSLVRRMKQLKDFPIKIGFELLESIYMEEEDDAFHLQLDTLRELGARIELDDFGSGRASIVALTRIGADRLKIDKRLVEPIENSQSARKLIRACIDIGRALEIDVLAEGVETEGQANILRELGCSAFQGYLFAKPMLIDEIEPFIRDEKWRLHKKIA